ncbi:hypothetical protein EJB05_35566, partial [Eragrostis curvula]
MEVNKVLLVLSLSVLLIILSKLKSLLVAKPKLNLPPAPWMLPVIGSLHHLISSTRSPHQAMCRLAKKYGPIMMLRLGEVPALVLSSPEAAEEVLKTNDLKFADRNLNATLNALTYNCTDLTFAPYGERWRQLRKICVMELLNPGPARLLSYRHIREEEVSRFIQNLTTSAGTGSPVDLTKMIYKFINDTFVRESVGSRCKYQDEYLDAFRTALRQTSSVTVADIFPSSRLLQLLATAPRKVFTARSRMQRVLKQVIKEKMEAMDRGDGNDCFLGVLIRLQKERSTPVELTDNTVLALMFRAWRICHSAALELDVAFFNPMPLPPKPYANTICGISKKMKPSGRPHCAADEASDFWQLTYGNIDLRKSSLGSGCSRSTVSGRA